MYRLSILSISWILEWPSERGCISNLYRYTEPLEEKVRLSAVTSGNSQSPSHFLHKRQSFIRPGAKRLNCHWDEDVGLVQSDVLLVLESSGVICSRASETCVDCKWEAATVSGTVASQARHFPLAHGMREAPSGLKADPTTNPVGSLDDVTPACPRDLHRTSLSRECSSDVLHSSYTRVHGTLLRPPVTRMDKCEGHTMQNPDGTLRPPLSSRQTSTDRRLEWMISDPRCRVDDEAYPE